MANSGGASPIRPTGRRDARSIDDLRNLIVGPDRERLDRVEYEVAHPPAVTSESISKLLPSALVDARSQGPELTWALRPVIIDSIQDTVATHPEVIARLISPVLGPSIGQAIAAALRELVDRFETILDRSVSLDALRWRFESIRSGKPYGEVVLLRSLVYRVEQVFLIHRETGLVLQHLVAADVAPRDADQVSAMLMAIDSFVRDAFSRSPADTDLSRFDVGSLTGLVQHGPQALLVAIVRGVPPSSLPVLMRTIEERIHLEFRDELRAFRGNASPFEPTRALLDPCVQLQARRPRRSWIRGRVAKFIAAALLVALVVTPAVLLGLNWARVRESRQSFERARSAIASVPGVVLTGAERTATHWVFAGIRDPDARDPAEVLRQQGVPAERVSLQFSPVVSLDKEIVERRAKRVLDPPDSLELRLDGDVLRASGSARARWLAHARTVAPAIAGVAAIDTSSVRAVEFPGPAAHSAIATLEGAVVDFDRDSAALDEESRDRVEAAASAAASLARSIDPSDGSVNIVVTGHADPIERRNTDLALARARTISEVFRSHGVPSEAFTPQVEHKTPGIRDPKCVRPVERSRWRCEREWSRSRVVTFDPTVTERNDSERGGR